MTKIGAEDFFSAPHTFIAHGLRRLLPDPALLDRRRVWEARVSYAPKTRQPAVITGIPVSEIKTTEHVDRASVLIQPR